MGGKWIIRLRKGLASRCWENLILAMLGEQFMVGEEICGAVVSVRFQVQTNCLTHMSIQPQLQHIPTCTPLFPQEDIISIWNKTASDQATTARIRDTLRRVLNLPPNTIMEYKTHTDSIKYVCPITLLFFFFFSAISACLYTSFIKYIPQTGTITKIIVILSFKPSRQCRSLFKAEVESINQWSFLHFLKWSFFCSFYLLPLGSWSLGFD